MPLTCGCDVEIKSCAPYASVQTVQDLAESLCATNCSGEVPEGTSTDDFLEVIGASECCDTIMVKRGNCLYISFDGISWQEFCGIDVDYSFKAYSTIEQDFPVGEERFVNYNTVLWDTSSFYTATNYFTVPIQGYYLVIANMRIDNDGLLHRLRLRTYQNGTIANAVLAQIQAHASSIPDSITSSTVLYCQAGDYIQMAAQSFENPLVKAALTGNENRSNFISIHKL